MSTRTYLPTSASLAQGFFSMTNTLDSVRRDWQLFTAGLTADLQVRPVIRESWLRCRQHNTPADRASHHQVPTCELHRRMRENAALITAAAPLLDIFSRDFPQGIDHCLYLADAEGIVLFSTGTEHCIEQQSLLPGFDRSERCIGTNGAGTALAIARPIAVVGPEHYQCHLHECLCLASPITVGELLMGSVCLCTHMSDGYSEHLEYIHALAELIGLRVSAQHM